MTTPPPGWQPDQQPGPFPPHHGQPPGFDPQPPPPPGWQQGPWQQPPQKGSSIKWLLIAVAVLLVIAISVGGTLLFTRDGGGGGETTSASSPPASDIASAGDTGPVAVILAEPTCSAFDGINRALFNAESRGWTEQHAALGAATDWTPDQRTQMQVVTTAMRNAADQMVQLAKQTPHRVVRELYEQFIAYSRAYADSVPNYVPADNLLADITVNIGNSLVGICNSIEFGSALRASAMSPVNSPTHAVNPTTSQNPQLFAPMSETACSKLDATEKTYKAGAEDWENLDSSVPASEWSLDRRAAQEAVLPVLTIFADKIESAGRQSGTPIFEDFAVLAAVYTRAFVSSGDSYTGADTWLFYTSLRLNNALSASCAIAAR